jgi:hypothetical protein
LSRGRIAIDGEEDTDSEAFDAADTAVTGVALWCRGQLTGDRAGTGHRTEHGARVPGPSDGGGARSKSSPSVSITMSAERDFS